MHFVRTQLAIAAIFSIAGVHAAQAQCNVPSATYPTIQSAASDSTCTEIDIAAGTYTEQVTVGQPGSVFVHGAGEGRTIIQSPFPRVPSTYPTTYYPNYTYIVQIPPGTAATITDLTIDGGSNSYCGEPLFGVRFNNSGGNLTRVVVDHVESPGAAFGCQNTVAVAATAEAANPNGDVTIENCVVRNFQKVGILYNGTGSGGIVENTILHGVGPQTYQAQNGIQFSRGAAGEMLNNLIDAIHYTGDTCVAGESVGSAILTYQAGLVDIILNGVFNDDVGIYLSDNTGAQTVYLNQVYNNYCGIYSNGNTAGVVSIVQNGVTNTTISPAINAAQCFAVSGDGIVVTNESGTSLSVNAASYNSLNGIEFTATATNGTISQSQLNHDTVNDLLNSGTGNTATLNRCVTSSPAGLCTSAP